MIQSLGARYDGEGRKGEGRKGEMEELKKKKYKEGDKRQEQDELNIPKSSYWQQQRRMMGASAKRGFASVWLLIYHNEDARQTDSLQG
jgi:hypothetical protein